jgi:hypothetical protein
MGHSRAAELLFSALSGFAGATVFLLLFYGVPVNGQDKTIVKAREFLLLNDKNEIVGRLASHSEGGLPFLVLEGNEREGKNFKDGAVFIGFHEKIPQIRLHGGERTGGVVLSAYEEAGYVSIAGRGAKKIMRLDPSQADTWNALTKGDRKTPQQ